MHQGFGIDNFDKDFGEGNLARRYREENLAKEYFKITLKMSNDWLEPWKS